MFHRKKPRLIFCVLVCTKQPFSYFHTSPRSLLITLPLLSKGTNTFGKGIVQAVFGLSDGSGLKITESEYYLPNDECIHGVGIVPDVEAELDAEAYKKDGTDTQKQKAIEVMKELKKK